MKNILITLILTPIAAPIVAGIFCFLTVAVFVIGVMAVLSLPASMFNHLNQIDDDRKKLTGDSK